MKQSVTTIVITLAALFFMALGAPQSVFAAGAGQVTIDKRISIPTDGTSQATDALAGAEYKLSRVTATGTAAIDPAKPSTYQERSSVMLTTGEDGKAQATGLDFGTYILAEQENDTVFVPAVPVLFTLSAAHPLFAYVPKSGLGDYHNEGGDGTTPEGTTGHTTGEAGGPTTGGAAEQAGKSAARQPEAIMQTNGHLARFPWLWVLGLSAAILLTSLIVAVWLRKKVTAHEAD